jgi:hypothetical protein
LPYSEHDERVEVDLDSDRLPLHVDYREAHYRSAQRVEAFARSDGDRLDILVQPDVRPAEVRLYRRWDDWNVPNPPVLIGAVLGSPGEN